MGDLGHISLLYSIVVKQNLWHLKPLYVIGLLSKTFCIFRSMIVVLRQAWTVNGWLGKKSHSLGRPHLMWAGYHANIKSSNCNCWYWLALLHPNWIHCYEITINCKKNGSYVPIGKKKYFSKFMSKDKFRMKSKIYVYDTIVHIPCVYVNTTIYSYINHFISRWVSYLYHL